MLVEHIPDQCGRCRRVERQAVDIKGIDRENIAVRLVADGGACPAETAFAVAGRALHRPFGHQPFTRIAGTRRQRRCRSGDVEHDPVPPPAARRRIRVIHGHGETFRPFGRIRPGKGRRDILTGTAESVNDLLHRKLAPEVAALQCKTASIKPRNRHQTCYHESFHGCFLFSLGLSASIIQQSDKRWQNAFSLRAWLSRHRP